MGVLLPLTGQPVSRIIYHWPTQSVWRVAVIDLGRPDRIDPPVADVPDASKPTGMVARNVFDYILANGPQTTGQLARALAWVWEDGKNIITIQGTITNALARAKSGDGSEWFVQLGRVPSVDGRTHATLWGIRGLHGTPEGE